MKTMGMSRWRRMIEEIRGRAKGGQIPTDGENHGPQRLAYRDIVVDDKDDPLGRRHAAPIQRGIRANIRYSGEYFILSLSFPSCECRLYRLQECCFAHGLVEACDSATLKQARDDTIVRMGGDEDDGNVTLAADD